MIIYKITNEINKKIYIGQTKLSIEERFILHKNKRSNCRYLKSAFNKYGIENFKIEKIEDCKNFDELNFREMFWIKELNTLAPNGYNLTTGGAAPKHSDITKEKMSQTRKGKHPKWATEASTSLEARTKRSETYKNMNGSQWTEDRRNNAKKGAQYRAITVTDNFGIEYPSISEAARLTECQNECVRLIVLGKQKKTKSKDGTIYTFKYSQFANCEYD